MSPTRVGIEINNHKMFVKL